MGIINTPEQQPSAAVEPIFANWKDPLVDAFRDARRDIQPLTTDLEDLEVMRREMWAQRNVRITQSLKQIMPYVRGMIVDAEVIQELGDPPTIGVYTRRMGTYDIAVYEHISGGVRGYEIPTNGEVKSLQKVSSSVLGVDVIHSALLLRKGHLASEAYVVRLLHPETGELLVNLTMRDKKDTTPALS